MTLFQKSGDTRDVDREIMLTFEDSDLFNFCLLSDENPYISSLCNNEAFWEERAKRSIFREEFYNFKNKNKPQDTVKNTYRLFSELKSLLKNLKLKESVDEIFNLEILDLSHQLKELPREIGNLSNLQRLDLYNNQLKELPKEIGNLSELRQLYLANNQLKQLPDTLGNLSNLQLLDLPVNQLLQLPDTIGNLSSLQTLNLSYNQLLKIPDSIGNLSSLQKLYLFKNRLKKMPRKIKAKLKKHQFMDIWI